MLESYDEQVMANLEGPRSMRKRGGSSSEMEWRERRESEREGGNNFHTVITYATCSVAQGVGLVRGYFTRTKMSLFVQHCIFS